MSKTQEPLGHYNTVNAYGAAEAGRELKIICPDPVGSIYHDEFYRGKSGEPSIYRVEGIGHDFMVGTLDFSVIDDVLEISDRDSFLTARRLVENRVEHRQSPSCQTRRKRPRPSTSRK